MLLLNFEMVGRAKPSDPGRVLLTLTPSRGRRCWAVFKRRQE